MRCIILEAPFAPTGGLGSIEGNRAYARAAVKDCLRFHEAALWSPDLYAHGDVLDDRDAASRHLGMDAGFAWMEKADGLVVYIDLGLSPGMKAGVQKAEALGLPVVYRGLPNGALQVLLRKFTRGPEALGPEAAKQPEVRITSLKIRGVEALRSEP